MTGLQDSYAARKMYVAGVINYIKEHGLEDVGFVRQRQMMRNVWALAD